MASPDQNRFQVELRGLIELLSQHLYSGPHVFIRELLQNGVDAIQARRQIEPKHEGAIEIEVVTSEESDPTIIFQDNGVGLTEAEVQQFLATIGQSSKRGEATSRPDDFLGQFGIGLLSCFTVSDEIIVLTRSAKGENQPGFEWRGSTDGTYSVRKLTEMIPIGTQVFLQPSTGYEDYFELQRILKLTRDYGSLLQPKISLTSNGKTDVINAKSPWQQDLTNPQVRENLLAYGTEVFDRNFLDVFPLHSTSGGVTGVAYVLSEAVHAGSSQPHRVYLKNMLLSTKSHDVLPEWAFFVQCIVNATQLHPTASRESFYDDTVLERTRDELGDCLRRYLVEMAQTQPRRFEQLIAVHHLAVKALAADDDECLELFADLLPFQTSLGTMTLGEFRKQNPVVRYVPSCDQFRQIAQVAASESLAVINAGYVYDVDILTRLSRIRPDFTLEEFDAVQLADRFEQLSQREREETLEFERLADLTLQRFKCAVEIAKFLPSDLPSLYVTDGNADFFRSVEQAQDVTEGVWSDMLGDLTRDAPSSYARLYLNYSNSLIQRICQLGQAEGQRRSVEMVYIQALLLGHFPLKKSEIKLLNEGLLGLLDWAVGGQNND
ncbi:HSP90 family protein [Blastopirellula marina]|uniref:HSP90 family protein n=1 Tax=Blastopirellula marina TaxID=124 RepID=UPI0005906F10|nr:HSP90 family protein [Blastopirellula marina]